MDIGNAALADGSDKQTLTFLRTSLSTCGGQSHHSIKASLLTHDGYILLHVLAEIARLIARGVCELNTISNFDRGRCKNMTHSINIPRRPI